MTKTFDVSFISEGNFFAAGTPIEDDFVRPFMLHYEASASPRSKPKEVNLMRQYNRRYSVDADGFTLPSVGQQAVQLKAAAEQDEWVDDIANQPLDPSVQDALDEAQGGYRRDLEGQKLQAKVAAEHADELDDSLRMEQDEKVAAGDYDQYDVPREDSKPKPVVQASSKLFVKRHGKFLPANSTELILGEKLFRFRPRSFGISAKYIMHSVVKIKEEE
jgi:hypothetical protein